MKVFYLVLSLIVFTTWLALAETMPVHKKITAPGQFCVRWDGSVGISERIYNIRGKPSLICSKMCTERCGYSGYYCRNR